MHIKLNGNLYVIEAPMTIQALTDSLGLKSGQFAVERNMEIVPKSRHGEVMVRDGDEIEIVKFIGGG